MKSIIITILFIFLQLIVFAQETDKTVSITVSGSGKTQEQAKQAALRSAIEQAFGTFISSETEIFNDQVVADEIASVANGNIQSFTILNESQLPDSSWGVTLKAIVSVNKLTSFVEARGVHREVNGGLFALNIKQQLLNEQSEINAVCKLVGTLHEPMQISFDFTIKNSEPKSLDAESKNWGIPLVIKATSNKNIDFCAKYCINTLAALSLTSEEVKSYKILNKPIFTVYIYYKGALNTYFLRKKTSINALNTLANQWSFYTRLYTVQTEIDELFGVGKGEIHPFSNNRNYESQDIVLNFLTSDQVAATFFYEDKRTLEQIEKMTGYKVKPRGIISKYKFGGFVVNEENGHGLVVSIADLGFKNWTNANISCDKLKLNGYGDWALPSKLELKAIYENLILIGVGGFSYGQQEWFGGSKLSYWSSTEGEYGKMFHLEITDGRLTDINRDNECSVRAIRLF